LLRSIGRTQCHIAVQRHASRGGISPVHDLPFVEGERSVSTKLAPRMTTTTNDSAVYAALAANLYCQTNSQLNN
jgi:hypothetical protein